jgi:hypothetical protein
MFLRAVKGEFAVNASASKTIVIKPWGEKPFPASRTREHAVAAPGNRNEQHPRDGKHKDWFVRVKKTLG